jgi:dsRNA-specific ribonuclease
MHCLRKERKENLQGGKLNETKINEETLRKFIGSMYHSSDEEYVKNLVNQILSNAQELPKLREELEEYKKAHAEALEHQVHLESQLSKQNKAIEKELEKNKGFFCTECGYGEEKLQKILKEIE